MVCDVVQAGPQAQLFDPLHIPLLFEDACCAEERYAGGERLIDDSVNRRECSKAALCGGFSQYFTLSPPRSCPQPGVSG